MGHHSLQCKIQAWLVIIGHASLGQCIIALQMHHRTLASAEHHRLMPHIPVSTIRFGKGVKATIGLDSNRSGHHRAGSYSFFNQFFLNCIICSSSWTVNGILSEILKGRVQPLGVHCNPLGATATVQATGSLHDPPSR